MMEKNPITIAINQTNFYDIISTFYTEKSHGRDGAMPNRQIGPGWTETSRLLTYL